MNLLIQQTAHAEVVYVRLGKDGDAFTKIIIIIIIIEETNSKNTN